MDITAKFPKQKYVYNSENESYLVLTFKAPEIDWVSKRPSICIVPVIDVSGSMKGDKIEYAKKSALKLVDHLSGNDITGLVVFGNRVSVLVEPGVATAEHKDKMRSALEKLRPSGGTNFEGGLSRTLELVKNLDLGANYLTRVIMFTDGEPTVGVTDKNQIAKILENTRDQVTVSAFGYGEVGSSNAWNTCDQGFLQEFSQIGAGNYAYIQEPDAALQAFGKELGGLLSTYATNVMVSLVPNGSHRVTKVVSDVDADEDPAGQIDLTFPEILSQEERNLVFKVKLAEQSNAFPRPATVFDLKMKWLTLDENGQRHEHEEEHKAQVRFVKEGEEDTDDDAALGKIIGVAELVSAQIEAEQAAERGDYSAAEEVMLGAAAACNFIGEDSSLNGLARQNAVRLGSRTEYSASRSLLRNFAAGATRGYGVSSMDSGAMHMLDSAGIACSNSAQDQVTESFTGGSDSSSVPESIGDSNTVAETDSATLTEAEARSRSGAAYAVENNLIPSVARRLGEAIVKSRGPKPVTKRKSKARW